MPSLDSRFFLEKRKKKGRRSFLLCKSLLTASQPYFVPFMLLLHSVRCSSIMLALAKQTEARQVTDNEASLVLYMMAIARTQPLLY